MTAKDIFKITLNLAIIYIVGGVLLAGVYAKTSPIIFQKNKEEKEAALKAMMPMHVKMRVPEGSVDKVLDVLPAIGEPERSEPEGGFITLDAEVDLYKSTRKKLKSRLRKAGAVDIEEYSVYETVKAGDWEPRHKHAEYFEVPGEDGPAGYIVETYGKGYSSYPNLYVAVDLDFNVKKIEVLGHGETPGLGDEIETDWFKNQYRGKTLEQLEVVKGDAGDKVQAITGATISTRAVTDGVRDAVKLLRKEYAGEADEEAQGEHGDEH
jgi:electron transport complex protein RnfG